MENSIISTGLNLALTAQRGNGNEASNVPRTTGSEASAQATQQAQVQLNQDLPQTSSIPEVSNPVEGRTNQTNNAEQLPEREVQQQQIATFLAEQTGESRENFEGIDIQSALEIQETLRGRTADSTSPESEVSATATGNSSPTPADANEQQELELQQRLQTRLAEQIPTDPGTEFPPLIRTSA